MKPLEESLAELTAAVERGNGLFAMGAVEGSASKIGLAVGCSHMVRISGGYLVMIGMRREHLEEMVRLCTEALAEGGVHAANETLNMKGGA